MGNEASGWDRRSPSRLPGAYAPSSFPSTHLPSQYTSFDENLTQKAQRSSPYLLFDVNKPITFHCATQTLPETSSYQTLTPFPDLTHPLLGDLAVSYLTPLVQRSHTTFSSQPVGRVAFAAVTASLAPALVPAVITQGILTSAVQPVTVQPMVAQSLITLPLLPSSVQPLPITPGITRIPASLQQEAARYGFILPSITPVSYTINSLHCHHRLRL